MGIFVVLTTFELSYDTHWEKYLSLTVNITNTNATTCFIHTHIFDWIYKTRFTIVWSSIHNMIVSLYTTIYENHASQYKLNNVIKAKNNIKYTLNIRNVTIWLKSDHFFVCFSFLQSKQNTTIAIDLYFILLPFWHLIFHSTELCRIAFSTFFLFFFSIHESIPNFWINSMKSKAK